MLEVAGQAFAARGFHEASMDDIARAAGISKQMLYNYFGSKEGLYSAVVNLAYRDVIAAIDSAVAEAVGQGATAEQQLRAGVRAYYGYVGDHRDVFRVLFREMSGCGGQLERQRQRLHRRVAVSVDAVLRDAGAPALMPGATDAMAEAFLGAARGLAEWWLEHPEWEPADVEDQLMRLALVGMRGRAGDLPRRPGA